MTFDIVTIFPAMIEQSLSAGIIGRAIERGLLDVLYAPHRADADHASGGFDKVLALG